MNEVFQILLRDEKTRARLGRIKTRHGDIQTPSYVVVGTDAVVRCLEPEDIPGTKTQAIIANTYHLWRELGDEGLNTYPGLHEVFGWQGPIMTDSGGFQVFSLGSGREHASGKVGKTGGDNFKKGESIVQVSESGVTFREGKEELYLDAELSMRIQEQLGADIIFAFDEPSSPHHDYDYTKAAMERTHRWATRSLDSRTSKQLIYGIVQGGSFEDLRRESAHIIGGMPFDGLALGGAFGSSFGSTTEATKSELEWTVPLLPEDKPRHLLGMGKIEDLFYGVENGIDTFDCVIPTREARHGGLWTKNGRFDICRGKNVSDGPIEEGCGCAACLPAEGGEEGISRRELHHLFKAKDLKAGRFATIHNVYFFNDLMEEIRNALQEGRFLLFKKEYLKRLAG